MRRIEFLRTLDVSLLTQRRGPFAPFGLDGGQPGKCGENVWEHADGRSEVLPALCHLRVLPGDILRIETPGGGGFGES